MVFDICQLQKYNYLQQSHRGNYRLKETNEPNKCRIIQQKKQEPYWKKKPNFISKFLQHLTFIISQTTIYYFQKMKTLSAFKILRWN